MKPIGDEFLYAGSLFKVLDSEENMAAMLDEVLWPFIQLFLHHDKLLTFMDSIVKKEVQECLEESVLFRKNSIASKLFSRYTLSVGDSYLKEVVGPLVIYIAEYNHSFEVDPLKLAPENAEEIQANQEALLDASLHFLQRLLDTIDLINPGLRFCFHIIQRNVLPKFPDAFHKSVGGFFFLRLICPVVAACDQNRLGIGKYSNHLFHVLTRKTKMWS